MIKFTDVSFSYRKDVSHRAIDTLTLSIESGEEIAIIGGNGSGKTTLGLLLGGIIEPDSGSIEIDGKRIGSGTKPSIGFLFQDPDNGLVASTVEREVAFSLENQNLSNQTIRREVDRGLKRFDLETIASRLIRSLSGGEKQRLALAGLFVVEPGILFLDEPASFLDFGGVIALEETLKMLKNTAPSVTIIRITQYPHVAEKYSRLVLMDRGSVIKEGSPADIFSDLDTMTKSGLRPPLKFQKLALKKPARRMIDQSPKPEKVLYELEDLHFGYEKGDDNLLFDGAVLDIYHNEILALVGPSGCGKSTLAQIICGLHKPLSGRAGFSKKAGRGVMSFQQPERQFFLTTAFEEVAYAITAKHSEPEQLQAVVKESMETAGLDFEQFRERDPHSLSGGEARRLAFAVIIALDADIYIFDEPTCGLDEAGILNFKKMVAQLRRDNKMTIIISHDANIIADLSERVAIISDGKISSINTAQFFTTESYRDFFRLPEAIEYQLDQWGEVYSTRSQDILTFGQN